MAILTGTHESRVYRDNRDEATALHQTGAASRLLLHAAGPCHVGDGSAADCPALSHTWPPPPWDWISSRVKKRDRTAGPT